MPVKQSARRRSPAGANRAARAPGRQILQDVLCGVDGTRTSYEAVRQAAALTGRKGHLSLLAVTGVQAAERQRNSIHQSQMSRVRVQRALDHSRAVARHAGVRADAEVDRRTNVAEVLLERAQEHSLLAVGAPSMSRLAHLVIGGVTTTAVHKLPTSLLIARQPPRGVPFAGRIVVASDAGADSDKLLDFGIGLALARDAELLLIHAAGAESRFQPTRLGGQAERIGKALGHRGRVSVVPGRSERVIIEGATQADASLVLLSSRHLKGVRALASVSERVVHGAPCSVLVVRPEDLRR